MKSISGLDIQKLYDTTSPSSGLIYLNNFLLYNESKIDKSNINANINVVNYDKIVVEYNQDEQSHQPA